jgi:pyruvate formate lyase activating enzyme
MQGWQKTSFVDYPQKIASVFFYGGCNFRCPYCHNGYLLKKIFIENIDDNEVILKLKTKKHIYEGIVISGGEPTIYKDLENILLNIKENLELPVKLDTNGTTPDLIKSLYEKKLIHYIAMDIKTSLEKYPQIYFSNNTYTEQIKDSIAFLKELPKTDYEFRSTLYPKFFEKKDLTEIAKLISGAGNYYLQQYNNKKTLIKEDIEPFSNEEILAMQNYFQKFVDKCEVR